MASASCSRVGRMGEANNGALGAMMKIVKLSANVFGEG